MKNIHIKFSGIDENAGVIFLQFATDETLQAIDQATIHGFFPSQYHVNEIEQLLPFMAEFGHQMLTLQSVVNQNKFSAEQTQNYNQLIGTTKTIGLSENISGSATMNQNQYNPDSIQNPNGQVDQMRNIVLEMLAEEGLILGRVK